MAKSKKMQEKLIRERVRARLQGKKSKATEKTATVAKTKRGRMTEEQLIAKYPHLVKGSLAFNAESGKQTGKIRCQASGCKQTRTVFTSDLFQILYCEDCLKVSMKRKAK